MEKGYYWIKLKEKTEMFKEDEITVGFYFGDNYWCIIGKGYRISSDKLEVIKKLKWEEDEK